MGNLMLHHNRSSQKHINQYTEFNKNTITKHELKRRPINLLPRQNAGKSESTGVTKTKTQKRRPKT